MTANYVVTQIETGRKSLHTGRELMEQGLPLVITAKPGEALVRYKRQ
jgi:hypothetical protein